MSKNLVDLKVEQPSDDDKAAADRYLKIAESVKIADAETMVIAQKAREEINIQLAAIIEKRMVITRKIDAAKKAVMDLFKPATSTLERALATFDTAIIAYDEKVEEQRKEEQRKADARAEAERIRLEALAKKRDAKGDADGANDAADRARAIVAPVIQKPLIRAAGVSIPKIWKHRVLDQRKIVPLFLMPDDKKIAATVKSLGKEAIDVVGVGSIEVFQEAHVSSARS